MKAQIKLLLKYTFYDRFVRLNLLLIHISGSVVSNYPNLSFHGMISIRREYYLAINFINYTSLIPIKSDHKKFTLRDKCVYFVHSFCFA